MHVNIIYKEIISPVTKNTSTIEVVEVEEDEVNAIKYAKLYGLQLPADDRMRIIFRTIAVPMS